MPFTQARFGYDWDDALPDVSLATGEVAVSAMVNSDSNVPPVELSGAIIEFYTDTPAVCTASQTGNLLEGRFVSTITLLSTGTCRVGVEMQFLGPYLVSEGEVRSFEVT